VKIYKKILELRKRVEYIQKTEQGAQGVSSSNVLSKVRPVMDELGLLLMPSITKTNTFPKKDYGKPDSKELFTEVWMTFTWVNAIEPNESISYDWYSQGLDMGEKGIGKAVTYAEKYFLLKSLNIPTDKDDPDTFRNRDVDYMTKIQGQAIKKKCDDIGLGEDGMKNFLSKHGISGRTNKQDADTFLTVIDDKLKTFMEG